MEEGGSLDKIYQVSYGHLYNSDSCEGRASELSGEYWSYILYLRILRRVSRGMTQGAMFTSVIVYLV